MLLESVATITTITTNFIVAYVACGFVAHGFLAFGRGLGP
jgi:hypothetical protein